MSISQRQALMTINWKLTLAYDGTHFHGWQVQPGKKTVQGILSDAIAAVADERVLPQGAGRTDAGVHAAGQVASFCMAAAIPPDNFRRALNRILPTSIRVLTAEHVSAQFHARHSSIGKRYRYRVFHGEVCSPFLAPYVACFRRPLDLEAMRDAAKTILGEHDFTSFAATDPDLSMRSIEPSRSNVRRIETSEWTRVKLPADQTTSMESDLTLHHVECKHESVDFGDELFTYIIRGDGFLHHMVRNLVGTFLDVGRGRIAAAEISHILDARDRRIAGPTAPASGLCLMSVLYE
jgi:tRNA pseudouridine38-40 synthase